MKLFDSATMRDLRTLQRMLRGEGLRIALSFDRFSGGTRVRGRTLFVAMDAVPGDDPCEHLLHEVAHLLYLKHPHRALLDNFGLAHFLFDSDAEDTSHVFAEIRVFAIEKRLCDMFKLYFDWWDIDRRLIPILPRSEQVPDRSGHYRRYLEIYTPEWVQNRLKHYAELINTRRLVAA